MQSLSLHPQQDTTAWDSQRGLHSSATSQMHSPHNANQYSTYNPERDSTAQTMPAWQGQDHSYYDPYSYYGHGSYRDQEADNQGAYEAELGDDWDQLGFAAEPDYHDHGVQSQQRSSKAEPAGKTPSDQQLCSQFQVSGECPRAGSCHMAHGDLCEVCLLCGHAAALLQYLHGVVCTALLLPVMDCYVCWCCLSGIAMCIANTFLTCTLFCSCSWSSAYLQWLCRPKQASACQKVVTSAC